MPRWTEDDLARLKTAIQSGTQEVQYASGRRIRYHSMDEMLKLHDLMVRDINAENASQSGGNARWSLASFR